MSLFVNRGSSRKIPPRISKVWAGEKFFYEFERNPKKEEMGEARVALSTFQMSHPVNGTNWLGVGWYTFSVEFLTGKFVRL